MRIQKRALAHHSSLPQVLLCGGHGCLATDTYHVCAPNRVQGNNGRRQDDCAEYVFMCPDRCHTSNNA